jgi:hypothetical protein
MSKYGFPVISDNDLKSATDRQLLVLLARNQNWGSRVLGNHLEHHKKLAYLLLAAALTFAGGFLLLVVQSCFHH